MKSGDRKNRLVGQVAGFSHRLEGFWLLQQHVFDFRLQIDDGTGGVDQTIPVQLRGMSIEGAIRDGDQVAVPGSWKFGQLLRPRKVYNLTTQSEVRAKRWASFATIPITFLIMLILATQLWIGGAVLAGGGLGSALRALQHAVLETLRNYDPCERLPRDISEARFEMIERLSKYRDIDHAMGLQKRIAQWETELQQQCALYREPELQCDALAHELKDLALIDSNWVVGPSVDQVPVLRQYYEMRRQWLRKDIDSLQQDLQVCIRDIAPYGRFPTS
jgi:hypothetical protein